MASVADTNRLYRNEGNCLFTNISASAGFGYATCSFGPIWGDINNDGLIDLFVANDAGENKLYRNDGNNTFTDITNWAGVGGGQGSYQGILGDVDGDGDLDLYVVNRYSAYNTLFQNDGSGRFIDVTFSAGVGGSTENDQGTVFGDYDNDGDLDIFVAYYQAPNILYENDGAGHFVDVASAAGVADTRGSISAAFGDFDNDGYLDLYVGNAHEANILYRNNGAGTFTDVTGSAGVGDPGRNIGMALGDTDDDGDLDIYVTNYDRGNVMYRNNVDNCDFLKVRLVGTVSNRDAIGAKVMVYDCGHIGDPGYLKGFREVNAGSGIWSMDALESHFGVEEGNLYDVRVIFPSGIVVDSLNVAACQAITIIEHETSVEESSGSRRVPEAYALKQNLPNPFSQTTDIRYQIPAASHVALRVFDVTGRLMRTLVDEDMDPGYHGISWDGKHETGRVVSTGVYFYRLHAGDFSSTKKLLMLR